MTRKELEIVAQVVCDKICGTLGCDDFPFGDICSRGNNGLENYLAQELTIEEVLEQDG